VTTFAVLIQIEQDAIGRVLQDFATPAAGVLMLYQTPVVMRRREFSLGIVVGPQESRYRLTKGFVFASGSGLFRNVGF